MMPDRLGERGFAAFKTAVETGDVEPLMSLCDLEIRFFVPLPFAAWLGEQRGRERLRELFAFERGAMGMAVTLTCHALLESADGAVALFEAAGANRGGDYANRLAIALRFESDRLVGFTEYTAQVDPDAVAAVTGN